MVDGKIRKSNLPLDFGYQHRMEETLAKIERAAQMLSERNRPLINFAILSGGTHFAEYLEDEFNEKKIGYQGFLIKNDIRGNLRYVTDVRKKVSALRYQSMGLPILVRQEFESLKLKWGQTPQISVSDDFLISGATLCGSLDFIRTVTGYKDDISVITLGSTFELRGAGINHYTLNRFSRRKSDVNAMIQHFKEMGEIPDDHRKLLIDQLDIYNKNMTSKAIKEYVKNKYSTTQGKRVLLLVLDQESYDVASDIKFNLMTKPDSLLADFYFGQYSDEFGVEVDTDFGHMYAPAATDIILFTKELTPKKRFLYGVKKTLDEEGMRKTYGHKDAEIKVACAYSNLPKEFERIQGVSSDQYNYNKKAMEYFEKDYS